jgi:hypothetical protein
MKINSWSFFLVIFCICVQMYISYQVGKNANSSILVIFITKIIYAIVLSWIAEFLSMKIKNREWEIDSISAWYLFVVIAQFFSNFRIIFPS